MLVQAAAISQTSKNTTSAMSAIKEADLKKDLFALASDKFNGREAGTLDELKVATWWADQLRVAGLKPAGDNSTYFQFFSMKRNRIAPNSSVKINNQSLQLWKDVLVAQTSTATISATIIFAGKGTKVELDNIDVKGKAVAIQVSPEGFNSNVSLWERRFPGYILNKFRNDLTNRGAAGIVFITDDLAEQSWNQVVPAMSRGLYDIEGGPNAIAVTRIPVFWLHKKNIDWIQKEGALLTANIVVESFEYPSVNVVAKIDGTDPVLKQEYVLFSSHNDHDGVRLAYGADSIYNGADDNATVSVAILAIARAFKKQPGRRSTLFVWHGAEERGLLGSKWYATHPTVPQASIVAVLNGDMIGRNHPDSASLMGVYPPHRSSTDLVKMGLASNKEGPDFKLDTLWDKADHVEGWFFRSDHLPYVRIGIPSLYYSSLLHSDYHTPMDEADRIDYSKLKKMTEWIYRTGWKVTNANNRPVMDPDFKLER